MSTIDHTLERSVRHLHISIEAVAIQLQAALMRGAEADLPARLLWAHGELERLSGEAEALSGDALDIELKKGGPS